MKLTKLLVMAGEFSLCFDISVEMVRQKQTIGRRYSMFIIARGFNIIEI
jgi:hypothetical protein